MLPLGSRPLWDGFGSPGDDLVVLLASNILGHGSLMMPDMPVAAARSLCLLHLLALA